ncbi:PREDICTED: RING-H2 finger protein ATL70-like [Lupinus angustifolius]|uniref:RING-H2 finger protein ATL70-like n=1 Tax=Lupinus angustifolius TaxID=3871 RepID=UPI00092F7792|nr:PREDICTED: RING-H2 finger protein ATL70-like [Lupinus angustifolius]
MNNTTNSSSLHSSITLSNYGYGIAISIGIILLILTISLTLYFCTRSQMLSLPPTTLITRRFYTPNIANFFEPQHSRVDVGLDEETILSYPKFLYSEAKLKNLSDSTATCCIICLGDYKGSDMIRVLPDCGHQFHLNCIDPWLRLHPTCPVCRTSPMPTPI